MKLQMILKCLLKPYYRMWVSFAIFRSVTVMLLSFHTLLFM